MPSSNGIQWGSIGEGIPCRALGVCEGTGPLGDIEGLQGQVSPGGNGTL